MARTKRGLIYIGAAIAIMLAILVGARFYIGHRLKKTLSEKIESLERKGYSVDYDTLYLHWRKGRVVVKNLTIQKLKTDSACAASQSVSVEQLKASGLSLIDLIFRRELNFKSAEIEKPYLTFKGTRIFDADSLADPKNDFSINVSEIYMHSARVLFWDSASCKVNGDLRSSIRLNNLSLNWYEDKPLKFSIDGIAMDSSKIELPEKFYSLFISKSKADLVKGTVDIDSFRIKPYYNKITFGRKKGFEVDRIEGIIPYIKLSGVKLNYEDTLIVDINKASLQMFLKVFRDKRLIFKRVAKPLPVQLLQTLDMGINIDTLHLAKSYVEYEEFSEKAKTSGKVFFDDLQADIFNINNDVRDSDGQTVMYAKANLMGEATIVLKSVFPWNGKKQCLMEGSVRNLSVKSINPLMESVANVKAESGKLELLAFRFAYNNVRSDGNIELNYRDLKLITYKDDDKVSKKVVRKRRNKIKEVNKEENKLKTWILNNFIIRRDVDEKDPEDKRTGTIEFYRDVNRSIFNYWWKSLLSGLRSAFDLERFNEKDNNKNRKKQKLQTKKKKGKHEPA